MIRISWAILFVLAATAAAESGHPVDSIYRLFLAPTIDLAAVEAAYASDIIHVGAPNQPLLIGRDAFIQTNILPLASMIESGQARLTGRIYIVRREIGSELVHDVGYFYVKVQVDGQPTNEQLQKFSWVFRKTDDGIWQVITDFDATPAELSLLGDIAAIHVIEP